MCCYAEADVAKESVSALQRTLSKTAEEALGTAAKAQSSKAVDPAQEHVDALIGLGFSEAQVCTVTAVCAVC